MTAPSCILNHRWNTHLISKHVCKVVTPDLKLPIRLTKFPLSHRAQAVEAPSAAVVGDAPTVATEPEPEPTLAPHQTNEATESSSAIGNGPAVPLEIYPSSGLEVDTMAEADLKENGFRSTRRTKLICTIGPSSCSPEQLENLAIGGMNVARLNMCHGTHEWHRQVGCFPSTVK